MLTRKCSTMYQIPPIYESIDEIRDSNKCSPSPVEQEFFAKQVYITGAGLINGFVGLKNFIQIDMNTVADFYNPVTIKVVGPSKAEVDQDIRVELMEINYRVSKAGNYSLSILYDNFHVKGSPFNVNIVNMNEQKSNPKAVKAWGKGIQKLSQGEVGKFRVNTKRAGIGQLDVSIAGPSKVFITCIEEKESSGLFKVSYTPYVAGYYFVHVKYNGTHITGSPFRTECKANPAGLLRWDPVLAGVGAPPSPELPHIEKNSKRRRWIFV